MERDIDLELHWGRNSVEETFEESENYWAKKL